MNLPHLFATLPPPCYENEDGNLLVFVEEDLTTPEVAELFDDLTLDSYFEAILTNFDGIQTFELLNSNRFITASGAEAIIARYRIGDLLYAERLLYIEGEEYGFNATYVIFTDVDDPSVWSDLITFSFDTFEVIE